MGNQESDEITLKLLRAKESMTTIGDFASKSMKKSRDFASKPMQRVRAKNQVSRFGTLQFRDDLRALGNKNVEDRAAVVARLTRPPEKQPNLLRLAPSLQKAPTQARSRFCGQCGSRVKPGAVFCAKCGAKLKATL